MYDFLLLCFLDAVTFLCLRRGTWKHAVPATNNHSTVRLLLQSLPRMRQRLSVGQNRPWCFFWSNFAALGFCSCCQVRRTALQMLLKMTKNVEDNPSETKFRRIKMANPAQISVLSHAVTMVEGQQRWQGSIVVGFEPKAKGLRNGSCKNDIKHLQSYGHMYVSTLFHTYKYDYDYSLQDCTSTFACGHIDTCKRIVHVAHMQMNPLDSY